MDVTQARAEWLSWDGTRLRWRLVGGPTGVAAFELRLDGVVFQRYPAAATGAHEFECAFPYSPTGRLKLAFSIDASEPAEASLLPTWHVRCGEGAAPGTQMFADAPQGLASLPDTPRLPAQSLAELPPVAIVVPIYNSPQCVQRCIEAVLRWSAGVQLVLIDDASTDTEIGPLLRSYAGRVNVHVHRNERNRGYTHSVNIGMGVVGGADVVLLNSDTEVGPRWLASLRLAAYAADNIGTVTAVSDNAGAFSVPELEQYCPVPAQWDLVQGQRAVLQQAGLRHPQLPTGNGFCMFVKRALIARIGPMDEAAFPMGYGEENDFCQRAERAGYHNLIAGNVLVHHERSASFGDARRAELGAQGMTVLRQRYPDYEARIGATLLSFERRVVDYRVRRAYADTDRVYATHAPRARLLLAANASDAGAERLLSALDARHEGFLLRREADWVNLYRYTAAALKLERGMPIGRDPSALRDIETRLREWLVEYAIESVHLRGSAASDGWLAGIAASLEIPVT